MEGQMPHIEPKAAITIRSRVEFASRSVDSPEEDLFFVGGERRDLARKIAGESLVSGGQLDSPQSTALELGGPCRFPGAWRAG
jgi:hypothetical protein